MNEPTQSSEDQTILAVLDALGSGGRDAGRDSGEIPVLSSDETAETLARLYTESLGLVPYELDPVAPRPEVRDRLMAAVTGAGGTGERAVVREAAPPSPAPVPVPVPAPAPVVPLRPSQEVRVQRPAPVPPVRRSRWPLAIAATIAFLALGLSGLLFYGLLQQGEKIEQLTREKNAVEGQARQAAATEAEKAEMERMREHLALVTSPAVEVSPMRPVASAGEAPSQPNARGVLYVKADHQHWYLALEGLEPAPPGKTYKLWFEADRPVSGGAFTAVPGAPVQLGSKEMPAGTKSVMVTLEDDPEAAAPEGPEILRAAAVYQIS